MRYLSLVAVVVFGATVPLSAARIAVSDFQVQSANPDYRFLGKGFTEFVSIEMSKAERIEVIDREKRLETLREIELSQTGLVDEKAQIEAGRMLTAEYIIFGNVYDINNQLSITVKIVETATSKIIFQEKVSGKLSQYDSLSAAVTEKILTKLNILTPASVRRKSTENVNRQEAVALQLSSAVDAIDRKDIAGAEKSLRAAKKLDPENEAVTLFLQKLVVNTAKFKTISQEYFPNTNPAFLGFARHDRIFLSAAVVNLQETTTRLKSIDRTVIEQDIRANLGYQTPIGKRWGAGVEAIFFHYKDEVEQRLPATVPGGDGPKASVLTNPDSFGGIGSLSYAVTDNFSIGTALALYQQVKRQMVSTLSAAGSETNIIRSLQAGLTLGIAAKNDKGTVLFDTLVGYSTQSTFLLDPVTVQVGQSVKAPIYNENTLTFGLFGKRVFLALKQINDFYQDRDYYAARLIPVLEIWLLNGFAVRGGAEGSYAQLNGERYTNAGWVAGLSLRGISSGWDFDINYTDRTRPSRVITGEIIREGIVYFTLSKSNNFVSR
jgi:TolB-like protein